MQIIYQKGKSNNQIRQPHIASMTTVCQHPSHHTSQNLRSRVRQKLVLGVFLCLSIAMIGVALTRISAYRLRGGMDLT